MVLSTAALCLALNVYHEARNQPMKGQYAVAHVTMNRAGGDPKRVCGEVFRPYQFSWANPLTTVSAEVRKKRATHYMPKESEAWINAKFVAKLVINKRHIDPTTGATHYHASYVNPYWNKAMDFVAKIGDHKFYRDG